MRPLPRLRGAGFANLRLAVVSPFVDRRHGTERAVAELLQRLARRHDCEIHLYAQRVEDLPLAGRQPEAGAIFWHKVPSLPGPHVVQFVGWMFCNSFLRRWHVLRGAPAYDLVLSPGINCLHPDVVLVHALFHRLRELAKEQDEDARARGGFLRRFHRRVYYSLLTRLERRIYSDPRTALAAVSKRTAHQLKAYFRRDDVWVIPNGIDTEFFSPSARLARRAEVRRHKGFRDEDYVLLLVGNDWRVKGLPAILEAMETLRAVPLRLVVVGNEPVDYFRAEAASRGLKDSCRFEPPASDVIDFYAAADVYVSPSREDSFGLPVAEAMACGLPVITSSSAGVAELIREGVDGFVLHDPKDSRELARILQQLSEDRELCRRVGEAARQTTLAWDWDRHAAGFWEVVADFVAKNTVAASASNAKS